MANARYLMVDEEHNDKYVTSTDGMLCVELVKNDNIIRVCGPRSQESLGKRSVRDIRPNDALDCYVNNLLSDGWGCIGNAYVVKWKREGMHQQIIIPFSRIDNMEID